jgi:hypothetical protein
VVYVHLRASKTDPFRQGVTLQVYSTGNQLCPCTAVKSYVAARSNYYSTSQSPFFMLPSLQPLTRQQFIFYFDNLLQILNLPVSAIRPHSFRIGAATSAAAAGVPDHLLKTLGRWSSDCYQRYIRTPASLIAQAYIKMSHI